MKEPIIAPEVEVKEADLILAPEVDAISNDREVLATPRPTIDRVVPEKHLRETLRLLHVDLENKSEAHGARQVVARLLDSGAHVRALTRDPKRAALPTEVEVIRGNLTVPETMDAAVRGVDAVFLVWTAAADAFPGALARIAQHTGRVVMLTSPHQTPHPFFQQPNPMAVMHKNMERLVRESGVISTFVRPGMFAANALSWWAARIRENDVVRWPYGDAATAPIDERDIAAVAVGALLDDATGDTEYMITGPDSLTQREQVITIGDVIGRTLRFEEITPDDARRELGFPPAAMDMLLNAWSATIGLPAYITTTVAEVTGIPARTFAEWVRSNKQAFARA